MTGFAGRTGKGFWIFTGGVAAVAAAALLYHVATKPGIAAPAPPQNEAAKGVDVSPVQLKEIKVEPVASRAFTREESAVGRIDFNGARSAQVFPPYQGKIIAALRDEGDAVDAGEPLFTLDSPDLIQSESTLITAAGVRELATKNLNRDRDVYAGKGLSARELDQAVSDQQAAEGALNAARNALRLFGKTEADIDAIVARRQIDPQLVVRSPLKGIVTARNAAPGLLVQPGNAPAPYAVADTSSMWLIASVAESDIPQLRLHEKVKVRVQAWPDRVFEGSISTVGATVDSGTHRVAVRSEIPDPNGLLKPGMLATFVISTGEPVLSPAIPAGGIVREGDGTMTVWVTADSRHFSQRTVETGLRQDGYDQVLKGLEPGEKVATEGALFLDNALALSSE